MKKKLISIIIAIVIIGATIVPIASADPHYSTLNFSMGLSGTTRYYSKKSICHYATTTASTSGATGVNYSVALVRGSEVGAPSVAFHNVPRNGTSAPLFLNVGAGNYHFRYSKSNDGKSVISSNLKMYSFSEDLFTSVNTD